jgi:hypothetical protein
MNKFLHQLTKGINIYSISAAYLSAKAHFYSIKTPLDPCEVENMGLSSLAFNTYRNPLGVTKTNNLMRKELFCLLVRF